MAEGPGIPATALPDKQQTPSPRKAAEPMTVARFRRTERKKIKQTYHLARTFAPLWPDIDNGQFRPMMVGIREQMLAYIAEHPDCGLTASQCVAGIASVVRQAAYYVSLSEGAFRYDIHGECAGTVTAEEAHHAARKVKRLRDRQTRILKTAEKSHNGTEA